MLCWGCHLPWIAEGQQNSYRRTVLWEACSPILQDRFKFLMQCVCFFDHSTIRTEFCYDQFARCRWVLTKFEENARNNYTLSKYVCIDETLRNSLTQSCQFLIFMQDKPGQMGIFSIQWPIVTYGT